MLYPPVFVARILIKFDITPVGERLGAPAAETARLAEREVARQVR